MPESAGTHRSADQIVRDAVASAYGRRRRRETARVLWQWAPRVALVCALIAAAGRWLHWSLVVPAVCLGLAAAATAIYLFLESRTPTLSDDIAATVDADAGLGGELRSAVWFAGRETRDEWADYHLRRAADRVQAQNWATLYPSYRSPRARAATAACMLAALVLMIGWPGRAHVAATAAPAANATGAIPEGPAMPTPVPDDLRKQIEEFLASVEKNKISAEQEAKTAAKLWNYMATFNLPDDPDALKKLAKMMDPSQKGSADGAAKKMLELADKANKAADASSIPPELRKAMQDLGTQLSEAADAEQRSSENAAQQNASAGNSSTPGEPGGAQSLADMDKSSIQFSKDNNAGAGASMMMMAEQNGQRGGGSSSGYGGAGGPQGPKNGTMPAFALEQALRHETIEASTDTPGDNVLSETRRKTEHTDATVGYTQGAAGPQVRSQAAPPPAIPEDRRSVVETYFTRKQ